MDGYTFVAEVLKATAWPIAGIVIFLFLRQPIHGLIDGIKLSKLKRGAWEADFTERAQELRSELPEIDAPSSPATDGLLSEFEPLLTTAPTAAVVEGWKQIEETLHSMAVSKNIAYRPGAFSTVLNALIEKGAIQPGTGHTLAGLRQLRNLAVHGPGGEVSEHRAREFLTIADALLWSLRSEGAKASKV